MFWALSNWSFWPPPSPVVIHRQPSGPNWSCPPLWFGAFECSMFRSGRLLAGSACTDRWPNA
jgi:hypothetical protein